MRENTTALPVHKGRRDSPFGNPGEGAQVFLIAPALLVNHAVGHHRIDEYFDVLGVSGRVSGNHGSRSVNPPESDKGAELALSGRYLAEGTSQARFFQIVRGRA
jgi:hypothetical protein